MINALSPLHQKIWISLTFNTCLGSLQNNWEGEKCFKGRPIYTISLLFTSLA